MAVSADGIYLCFDFIGVEQEGRATMQNYTSSGPWRLDGETRQSSKIGTMAGAPG